MLCIKQCSRRSLKQIKEALQSVYIYIYTQRERERESVLEHSQVEFGRIKTKTKKTLPIILCRK